jgi:urease accessory protein
VQGSFNITCAPRSDGTTAVTRQSISTPWHLSKPYWTGEALLVQVVNATAGIFAGDQLEFAATLEPHAAVLLTSPSASRIHTMPTGEATLRQSLTIKNSAWLEWMPELFIPHRACRYHQHTQMDIEKGASVYFVESLSPGRVAHGESLAFDRIHWNTRIIYGGELVLAEHYPMTPRDDSLRDLRNGTRDRYFASAVLIHPDPLPLREWQETIGSWRSGGVFAGATRLADDVMLIRLLTDDSETMKNSLKDLRALLATALPKLAVSARKL